MGMAFISVSFCCKQLPLGGQEDLSPKLHEYFDDFARFVVT